MSSVSRRTFLATPFALAIGAAITSCTAPPAPVLIDPDREALTAALGVEQMFLANTLLWMDHTAVSREEVKAVVKAHVDRLASTLGTTASVTASPSPTTTPTDNLVKPVTTAELRQSALRAVASHSRASRTAGPQTAQLLASLAASDAAIAAALSEST